MLGRGRWSDRRGCLTERLDEQHSGRVRSAQGSFEVGGGDPDGFGSATAVVVGADTLCYALVVKKLDQPTAAHIHRGPKGVNGPVVIPFNPPNDGTAGTSSGCVSGVDPALLDDVLAHPAQYYWNVHTTTFPGGAIRGQVFVKPKA
ncbi:MAG TPA: CHRD domain-containing protein [Gaiellaceae bacterium]|nr:CHRD domain-containing protein [Gaiellaceae bacterium]